MAMWLSCAGGAGRRGKWLAEENRNFTGK